MENKSISAISLPPTEESPNGSCKIYISPDLTYGEITQLLCTLMFHTMNSFYQVYRDNIIQTNLNQKVEVNKKEARKVPLSEDAVMTEKELDAAIASAGYQIHDTMNIAVSNVLNDFLQVDPNLSFLSPEDLITNEAILKAEEECLTSLLDTLSPAQLAVANVHLLKLKERISKARDDYARLQLEETQKESNES